MTEKKKPLLQQKSSELDSLSSLDKSDLRIIVTTDALERVLEDQIEEAKDHRARSYENLYKRLRILRKIVFTLYMILPFFQRPLWCDRGDYLSNCQGDQSDPDYISTSNLPYLQSWIFALLEISAMVLLIFTKQIEYVWRPVKTLKVRNFFLTLFLILTICSDILYSFQKIVQLNSFIRPIFFVVYNKIARRIFVFYFKILYMSRAILGILAINILFFVCIGKTFFYDEQSYQTFSLGLYNMVVLQTTANFPDIMLQIYEHNRLSALYFVIFLIVNNILLVNMTVSIFYINYKNLMEEKTQILLKESKFSKFVKKLIISKKISFENIQILEEKVLKLLNFCFFFNFMQVEHRSNASRASRFSVTKLKHDAQEKKIERKE